MPKNEINTRSPSVEAYLLGMAHGALHLIQQHLVQGHHQEALRATNDALSEINPAVTKLYYCTGEATNEPV
jgi:hypothetical protein